MVPIRVLTVFVEVKVHVMGVVIHGGMLARVKRCPVVAEIEGEA